jgi:hypothetical protein
MLLSDRTLENILSSAIASGPVASGAISTKI